MFSSLMSNSSNPSCPPLDFPDNNFTHLLPKPINSNNPQQLQNPKKKRNLPGNPDPNAEVIALSPKTLMATNRFVCEICNKGFQRDQNLQLHRRGHNLPWKLKQTKNDKEIKKRVYVCPELGCVHNHPSRALGDLTGIKKHFCRKHGEKKLKCDKCSKIYAVRSDWKAHSKICGTKEYKCNSCGTLFSRRDSLGSHMTFCDALAEESAKISCASILAPNSSKAPFFNNNKYKFNFNPHDNININNNNTSNLQPPFLPLYTWGPPPAPPQKQQVGEHQHHNMIIKQEPFQLPDDHLYQEEVGPTSAWQKSNDGFTRDFLGLATAVDQDVPLPYTEEEEDHLQYDQRFGFAETCSSGYNWANY